MNEPVGELTVNTFRSDAIPERCQFVFEDYSVESRQLISCVLDLAKRTEHTVSEAETAKKGNASLLQA